MKIDITELYTIRLLVFLETAPQSNRYKQVMLTPDEFRRVSLSIGKEIDRKGDDRLVEHTLSEEDYTLPDVPDIYENP